MCCSWQNLNHVQCKNVTSFDVFCVQSFTVDFHVCFSSHGSFFVHDTVLRFRVWRAKIDPWEGGIWMILRSYLCGFFLRCCRSEQGAREGSETCRPSIFTAAWHGTALSCVAGRDWPSGGGILDDSSSIFMCNFSSLLQVWAGGGWVSETCRFSIFCESCEFNFRTRWRWIVTSDLDSAFCDRVFVCGTCFILRLVHALFVRQQEKKENFRE